MSVSFTRTQGSTCVDALSVAARICVHNLVVVVAFNPDFCRYPYDFCHPAVWTSLHFIRNEILDNLFENVADR